MLVVLNFAYEFTIKLVLFGNNLQLKTYWILEGRD